jgi:O-acetyl-ADP-ribose deacetylase (regulator of RNase III)
MTDRRPRCFVIMPFGEKRDADGQAIDFDAIYADLIEAAVTGPAMRAAGGPDIECQRCDRIAQAGWVHRQMIEAIHASEVVVVDLSTLNPNVFYELGVRHALKRRVTVLVCRQGTATPFNLQGFKTILYDAGSAAGLKKARAAIAQYVVNGLKDGANDSLVHEVLDLSAGPRQLPPGPPRLFKLARIGARRRIGLLSGDLRYIGEKIDLWVNSENTNMQMARFFDKAGSAVIRYFGAERDVAGQVTRDLIADELAQKMGAYRSVPPGTVIATGSGRLADKFGVRHVLHVAAVQGDLGGGYAPVKDIAACVDGVLSRADEIADFKPTSILLPLLGTGSGGAPLDEAIAVLLDATLAYFERAPKSRLQKVWFQVFNDHQMAAIERLLAARGAAGA